MVGEKDFWEGRRKLAVMGRVGNCSREAVKLSSGQTMRVIRKEVAMGPEKR